MLTCASNTWASLLIRPRSVLKEIPSTHTHVHKHTRSHTHTNTPHAHTQTGRLQSPQGLVLVNYSVCVGGSLRTCVEALICVYVHLNVCMSHESVCVCACVFVSGNMKWCFPFEQEQLVFNQPLHQLPLLRLLKLIRGKLQGESKMWSVMSSRAESAGGRVNDPKHDHRTMWHVGHIFIMLQSIVSYNEYLVMLQLSYN